MGVALLEKYDGMCCYSLMKNEKLVPRKRE